jgi:hypothetical protein
MNKYAQLYVEELNKEAFGGGLAMAVAKNVWQKYSTRSSSRDQIYKRD